MNLSTDEEIIRIIIQILYFIGLYISIFWLSVELVDKKENTKKKIKNWPGVAIILPCFNEEVTIEKTLDSVFSLDYPKKKLNVICVNDGSTDNTLKILKRLQKRWDFKILTQKNQGKYMALNNALKIIDEPYFSCLDADSYVDSAALKHLIEEFDDENISSVMPIMRVTAPQNLLQRLQWFEYIISVYYKSIMGKLDCIHVIPGPFGTYRTDIVKKLGGFRKAHLTEDLEMALRHQDNNYTLKQSMDAFVYTKPPHNMKGFISQRTRWYQGTLLNIKDYKHFIFNKKFEEFGMFHIPTVALGGFFLFIGVGAAIYLMIKSIYNTLSRWMLTHFDFMTYINNYEFSVSLLSWNWTNIFALSILMILLYIFVHMAFISTKERITMFKNFQYLLMFLYYFVIYRFVIAWIWFIILKRLIFKMPNKWDKVN